MAFGAVGLVLAVAVTALQPERDSGGAVGAPPPAYSDTDATDDPGADPGDPDDGGGEDGGPLMPASRIGRMIHIPSRQAARPGLERSLSR